MSDTVLEEWIIKPNGLTNEAWLDVIYRSYKNGEHWWKAGVKFDGCIHLSKAYNSPFPKENEEQDYIHICDIDDYIKMLISLKEISLKHFGSEWNK